MSDVKNSVAPGKYEVSKMPPEHQFCLRWNDHQSTLVAVFESLLESNTLVDCTLAAEGQCLKAHKVVLSACSPYFQLLLSQHTDKHPIVILKDVKFCELQAMIDYMYRGEVNIPQDQLGALLKAAESLQIRGLGGASIRDGSGRPEKPPNLHISGRDKTSSPLRSGAVSPPPRPHSSGGADDAVRSTHLAASRRGSVSPVPRKRHRNSRLTSDGRADAQVQINDPSEAPSHSQTPSVTEASHLPPLAPLSSSGHLPDAAKCTSWGEMDADRSSSLPLPPLDSVPPLAPLSFTGSTAGSSVNTEWHEMAVKRSSSPTQPSGSSATASTDSQKIDPISQILLVPKTEYVEVDEDSLPDVILDEVQDIDDSGPSHIDGSGSQSTGFAPWLENIEGVGDETGSQDMTGAYRTSQDRVPWPRMSASQKFTGEDCGCSRRCFEIFDDSKKIQILQEMKAFSSKEEHSAYLRNLIQMEGVKKKMPTLRRCSCKYFVRDGNHEIRVCKKAFIGLHGATEKQVRRICDHLVLGVTLEMKMDHRS